MTKLLLSSIILLSLTACNERKGPEPTTSKMPAITERSMTQSVQVQEHAYESNTLIEEIPILEDTPPVLATPIMIEESAPNPVVINNKQQIFTGGEITDGLDLKNIRYSQSDTRTRLVFDSYSSNIKATQSGNYTFTYNPSQKQIQAVINGYRKFSALGTSKKRTFSTNSIIKDVTLKTYMDDSGYKFNISLRDNASVNVFELKSPARIVVDITPN